MPTTRRRRSASCSPSSNGAALAALPGRRASRRRRPSPRLCPRQAQRRGRRFRRSDRLDPRACSTRRGWANGCASSSTSAPTISWSTKRRTPMPTNGRSSTRWPANISAGRARPTRAGGPCSWSATSSRRSSASRAPTRASSRRCAAIVRGESGSAREAEDEARRRRADRARIPRPVDRRQLPLGAGDPRRRRRGDRRGRP